MGCRSSIPHEAVASHHVVGLTIVGRGEDVDSLETDIIGQLDGIGKFRIDGRVAKGKLHTLTHIHIRIEIPHLRTAHTAAVAQLDALVFVDFVRKVQGGIGLPIGLV